MIFTGKQFAVKARKMIEADLVRHMKRVVPEQYHEILTPDYGVGCKRRIFDAFWLDSLNDPKIDLTTQPITSLQPRGVTLGPGRTYPDPEDKDSKAPITERHLPADVIILANGFELTTWLSPLKVIGKGGAVLQEVWDERGGPQAYMGNAMDGFPNLFLIFGPNNVSFSPNFSCETMGKKRILLLLLLPHFSRHSGLLPQRNNADFEICAGNGSLLSHPCQ